MGRKYSRSRTRKVRARRGGKFGSRLIKWAKKANNWLRKTKAVSKVSGVLDNIGVPYMSNLHKYSTKFGYGKGGSLRRAGAGTSPSGGALRRRRVIRRRRR